MSPTFALLLCLAVIAGGFLLERRHRRPGVTAAAWLPFFWMTICASRSISQWLDVGGVNGRFEDQADYLESSLNGSPVDRFVLGAMIVLGALIVARRKGTVRRLIESNRWLLILVLYLGVSAAWSDIGAVSLRRWLRLAGHVVMAAVLVSEPGPIEAVRSVMRRCAYFLIPLSVVFIKYYPHLGVLYTNEGKKLWAGVAIMKNGLAHLALVFTVVLVWELVAGRRSAVRTAGSVGLFDVSNVVLGLYLLRADGISSSATAIALMGLALAILALSRLAGFKRAFARSGTFIMVAACLFFVAESIFGVVESVVTLLGRNMTFTDRVPLWNVLIEFATERPLLGYGYSGFWTVTRARGIAQQAEAVTEAHNGYLEILLAGGVIGIALLALVLITALMKIERNDASDYDYNVLRLSFFVIVLIANVTESSFVRERDLMSFVFFVIAMNNAVPLSWRTGASSRPTEIAPAWAVTQRLRRAHS